MCGLCYYVVAIVLSLTGSTRCRARAQYVVCVSTSSLLSLVIDGFDTLPRSMCGLRSHVIAVIACLCMVFSPVAAAIAVGNVHTNWIGPAIARVVWSVFTRHRYRRMSLTGSTPCCARARCVVCVSTSSLSSLVSGVFDTPPRSRAKCRLC